MSKKQKDIIAGEQFYKNNTIIDFSYYLCYR